MRREIFRKTYDTLLPDRRRELKCLIPKHELLTMVNRWKIPVLKKYHLQLLLAKKFLLPSRAQADFRLREPLFWSISSSGSRFQTKRKKVKELRFEGFLWIRKLSYESSQFLSSSFLRRKFRLSALLVFICLSEHMLLFFYFSLSFFLFTIFLIRVFSSSPYFFDFNQTSTHNNALYHNRTAWRSNRSQNYSPHNRVIDNQQKKKC